MTKSRLKKTIALWLAITLMCGCFSACSNTVSDAEMRVPLAAEPTSLDPQIALGSESATIIANCFEGLMRLDGSGNVVPAAAKSVSVSADGKTYTFVLHEDSKWHINTNHEDILGENYETAIDLRVTAADFVFGLQRALSPDTKAADASRLLMIKNAAAVNSGKAAAQALGVKAIDEYTVQITLEYASGEFLQVLTEPVSMPCSQAFFEATKGRYGLNAACIICNGAFYLSRWYEGSSILLRRNPDNKHFQAKPYSVTFAFTADEKLMLSNLSDCTYAQSPLTVAQVDAAKEAGAQVTQVQNAIWGFLFNCSDETMRNNLIRIALVMATDFTDIKAAASGMSGTATGIVPPSCMVDGQPFTQLAQPLGSLAFNTAKAKEYYDKFTGGKSCEITVLCTSEYETAVRRVIQGWQQLFGISLSAKVEVVAQTELETRLNAGSYQCALAAIKTDSQTPTEFLGSFADRQNICSFSSSNYSSLISQLLSASGTQSIVDGCSQAQTYLIQNAVLCPLFWQSSYYASASNIKNVGFVHSGKTVLFYDAEMLKN